MNRLKLIFSIKSSREWIIAGVDAVCVALGFALAVVVSKIDIINQVVVGKAFAGIPIYVVFSFVFSLIFGVYRCIWRYSGIKDYMRIGAAQLLATVLFMIFDYSLVKLVTSLSTYVVTMFIVTMTLTFNRMIYGFIYNKVNEKITQGEVKRTMIIGAGHTSKVILEELLRKKSYYKPICIIDDDVSKINRELFGVPVVGNTNEIPKFAKRYNIETIIFAIPSIQEMARKTILGNCLVTECELKVLPFVAEMIHNVDLVGQIKDINIEDLLGRAPIKFDDRDVSAYITNNVVMVTGGGGSIGSELVRQIAKFKPTRIVIVEIYENCAYNIQQETWRLYGREFPLSVEIASVTDYDKMNELFLEYCPNIIFHAAAHKHVPLMETNPEEAVKNNVFGTYNTAMLAHIHKAKKFIMISTDKAVNPTNVMGATKRCCEMIVQSMSQQQTATEFASVRFGNVLGSNGSVIPLFTEQIKAGGPVTVTHKDIIRYFMTIPEAVSLVMQAGAFAHGGEIFVLDMGSPVKIVTLAENLIRMLGHKPYEDIDIKFSGLRPGEKLYEELLMGEEGLAKTSNNKIFIGKQAPIDENLLRERLDEIKIICNTNDKTAVVTKLKEIVPTFKNDRTPKEEKKNIKLAVKVVVEKFEAEALSSL